MFGDGRWILFNEGEGVVVILGSILHILNEEDMYAILGTPRAVAECFGG